MTIINCVFLIEELVLDPSENDFHAAFSYRPFCFFLNEQDAADFVLQSGSFVGHECWALMASPTPKFKYSLILRGRANRELPTAGLSVP